MADGSLKLGDLNASKTLRDYRLSYTQTGTPGYASPEVWLDQPHGLASDIWSLGCVLYELICLRSPFRSKNVEGLFLKVVKGIYPPIPSAYSVDLSCLVRSLLQTKPHKRPTIGQLLDNPVVG